MSGHDYCTLFYVSLEMLCFIFGIVCCVLSTFGLAILMFAQILGRRYLRGDFYWDEETTATFTLVIFLYMYCISLFVFSVLLSYGAHVRNSCLLKAYVVYGVVTIALTMTGATVYYCFSWVLDSVGFAVVLVACCLYSLLLIMIQRTYQQIHAEKTMYIAKLSAYLGR